MNQVKNQPVLKFVKKISTQPEPVVSRVGSRVPTHFDTSGLKHKNRYFFV